MSGPSDEEVVEVVEEEVEPPPVMMSSNDDTEEGDEDSVSKLTYKERALKAGRNYTVTDVPPLGTSIILGVQHYLTMLGATVRYVLVVITAFLSYNIYHPLTYHTDLFLSLSLPLTSYLVAAFLRFRY